MNERTSRRVGVGYVQERTDQELLEVATRASAALAELGYTSTPFIGLDVDENRTSKLRFPVGSIPIKTFWKAWWTAGSPALPCFECYKVERAPHSLNAERRIACVVRGMFPPEDCGESDRGSEVGERCPLIQGPD